MLALNVIQQKRVIFQNKRNVLLYDDLCRQLQCLLPIGYATEAAHGGSRRCRIALKADILSER